ncbi:cation/H(+) antiporter 14-like [Cornus florida]|uniref:cation/H(+) antiporter 14-like n=1 Tax=Cornus florida TaxID=4283 RepID=UPI00289C0A0C|nr:cation/H(+) antiporter 14-like [Cornus florida]
MAELHGGTAAIGKIPGTPGQNHDEIMVCQYIHLTNSKGCIWFDDDCFSYSMPTLLAQFAVIFFFTRTTQFILRPLKQSLFSAQIIAGIIMGPTLLARNREYMLKLFPPGGKLILETVADFAYMLHLFILGVKIDTTMLARAGKSAALIGTTSFMLPLVLGVSAAFISLRIFTIEDQIKKYLHFIAVVNSMSSFPVITSLLADLKILNSELGRLATLTCMVCDLWSYSMSIIMTTISISMRNSHWTTMWSIFWLAMFLMTIVLVLRPLAIWLAKQTHEGGSMKEGNFLAIVVMLLGCAYFSEIVGQSTLGTFMFGLALPDGPPLGSSLVNKLDAMSTGLWLPVKMTISGLRVNLFTKSTNFGTGVILLLIIVLGYIGKFTGTLLSACYCKVPLWDAICLALIMCCKGVVEAALYNMWRLNGIFSNQAYNLLIMSMLIVTGVATPLISYLYDPSRRYMDQTRSTILQSYNQNMELRILVCIHNEDNVPTIINLLEASHPTLHRPITVFVLNLMELTGRSASILVPNFKRVKFSSAPSRSDHIVNAFNYFVENNQGRVMAQHFTAVAPYASMHDDICMLALDKIATLVIVPFHKQWTIDGTVGATFPAIRTVNKNVIKKSPCSVGVLVDRGQMSGNWSVLTGQSLFRVALLFLGGADDRAALAYSSRMADHPQITLTVVWIKQWDREEQELFGNVMEDNLDSELIDEFRSNAKGNGRIVYREERVDDGVGSTRVIGSMEDAFDLFIVGRHHEPDSPLLLGLTEWSQCPELGVVGDMLATSDFQFSVLVLQEQQPEAGFLDNPTTSVCSSPAVSSRVGREPSESELCPIRIR